MTFESPLILESGEIFVESAILGFGIRNLAQGIRTPANDWNTESQFHWQRLEPSAWIALLRGRRLKENERERDYGRKFSSPSLSKAG